MSLSPSQLTTLKTFIDNTPALAALPNNDDGAFAIAAELNKAVSPSYWVWRNSISRSEIYHGTSGDATTWNWATYRTQSPSEQGAWTQMFMGDTGPVGQVNFRAGIGAIFTGSAPQTAQRDHCLAISRRLATVFEKLFAVAVTNPPANTGNNTGNARGATTNPDNLGVEGPVSFQDVSQARNP